MAIVCEYCTNKFNSYNQLEKHYIELICGFETSTYCHFIFIVHFLILIIYFPTIIQYYLNIVIANPSSLSTIFLNLVFLSKLILASNSALTR